MNYFPQNLLLNKNQFPTGNIQNLYPQIHMINNQINPYFINNNIYPYQKIFVNPANMIYNQHQFINFKDNFSTQAMIQ